MSSAGRFRPLAGFWFLNHQPDPHSRYSTTFPSPCGVLVLKFFATGELKERHRNVSVPLRGSGS